MDYTKVSPLGYFGEVEVKDYNGKKKVTEVYVDPIRKDITHLYFSSDTYPFNDFRNDGCPLLVRGVVDIENKHLIVWGRDVLHNEMVDTEVLDGVSSYYDYRKYFPIEIDKSYNVQSAYLRQLISDIQSERHLESKDMISQYNNVIKFLKNKFLWIKSSDRYLI